MADFYQYAPLLWKLEGGWSDRKSDRGGATMRGVTLATFREFYGSHKTKDDLKNISDNQWLIIMHSYWDRCKGDMIVNQSVADIFVDWHINSGISGIRAYQRAAGLKVDGIVGKNTLASLNAPDSEQVFNRIRSARESYFRKLVLNDGGQKVNLNGWLNRLRHFGYKKG